MNAEDLINELYDLLDKAWSLPLSHGRAVLDSAEVKQILDELKESLPKEIQQAKGIVADRSQILTDAKREAETVIRVAEDRAKAMVNQEEIVKQAQQKANEVLLQTKQKARELRKASNDYVDDLMRRADEGLTANLAELRKTRQNIKVSQRTATQPQENTPRQR